MKQEVKVFSGKGTGAIDKLIKEMVEYSAQQAEWGWFIHDSNTICWGDDSNGRDTRARMIVVYRKDE